MINEASKTVKYKTSRSNKGSHEFDKLKIIQILNSTNTTSTNTSSSNSIIWIMKFSPCGKLLATAGKDQIIKIWVLSSFYHYFQDLIKKFNHSAEDINSFTKPNATLNPDMSEEQAPFYSKPFLMYKGHSADILGILNFYLSVTRVFVYLNLAKFRQKNEKNRTIILHFI